MLSISLHSRILVFSKNGWGLRPSPRGVRLRGQNREVTPFWQNQWETRSSKVFINKLEDKNIDRYYMKNTVNHYKVTHYLSKLSLTLSSSTSHLSDTVASLVHPLYICFQYLSTHPYPHPHTHTHTHTLTMTMLKVWHKCRQYTHCRGQGDTEHQAEESERGFDSSEKTDTQHCSLK